LFTDYQIVLKEAPVKDIDNYSKTIRKI
jgi:hypothetical protein